MASVYDLIPPQPEGFQGVQNSAFGSPDITNRLQQMLADPAARQMLAERAAEQAAPPDLTGFDVRSMGDASLPTEASLRDANVAAQTAVDPTQGLAQRLVGGGGQVPGVSERKPPQVPRATAPSRTPTGNQVQAEDPTKVENETLMKALAILISKGGIPDAAR